MNIPRITSKHFLLSTVSIGLIGMQACQPKQMVKENSRPNIVFILVDDMGWADLPSYGNKFNEAPRISQMADDGMLFTQAYAAAPVCSPTRASIQSGQYPARIGIIDFISGLWRPYEEFIVPQNRTQHFPYDVKTIGELLKETGYLTGYFGKWHLGFSNGRFYPGPGSWHPGFKNEHHPGRRGYDVAIEYKGGGYFNPRFDPDYDDFYPHQPLSDILTDMSVDFIKNNQDTSFFLFLSHFDPHDLLDADSALIEKYLNKEKVYNYPCNAVYAAMIESVDMSVGRILDVLDETGLSENTIVFFFSDNGGLISRFDRTVIAPDKQHIYQDHTLSYIATSNAPLRSAKGSLYEGGIRVPLIVKWKNKIKPGIISNAPVISNDFFPTFLSLAGGVHPENHIVDGKCLIPELNGETPSPNRSLFWHYPVYHFYDVVSSAVIRGNWKLIERLDDHSVELYDLKHDLSETTNLANVMPEIRDELKAELKNWRMDVGADMPVKNPDFDPDRRYELGQHPWFQRN